jgi:hypothetical protein
LNHFITKRLPIVVLSVISRRNASIRKHVRHTKRGAQLEATRRRGGSLHKHRAHAVA